MAFQTKKFAIYTCIFTSFLLHSVLAENTNEHSHFEKFDWSKVLTIPPDTQYTEGNQILHFKSKNRHFSQSPEASFFATKYLSHAQPVKSDAEVLKIASENVSIQGAFIEMGVCTGKTINFIAALNPHKKIHGFDSFKGLPEDWIRQDRIFNKGTFAFKANNKLPPVLHNVQLYAGWFKDSLPQFKREILQDTPIAFLHIDCDIYSSTKNTFLALQDNIVDGTIIVFDELYNYPGYEQHEWRAFIEFLHEKKFSAEFITYNIFHEQVAIRINSYKTN